MYGTTLPKRCETPEALLVMAALPVCDGPWDTGGFSPAPPAAPPGCAGACATRCVFPLKCAAIMDCDEALNLMEGVGDVVF